MKRKPTPKPSKTGGHRVGTKRRDMRWQDEHGEIWASKFESLVYEAGRNAGLRIRKCDKGGVDTVSYHSAVRGASCQSCKSTAVSVEHRYTPDLCVRMGEGTGKGSEYYVEVKGYLRAPQRALLRSLCKARSIADLRFILQTDYRVSKSLTIGGWIDKYLKCRWAVWNGSTFPTQWNYNEPKIIKSTKKRNK